MAAAMSFQEMLATQGKHGVPASNKGLIVKARKMLANLSYDLFLDLLNCIEKEEYTTQGDQAQLIVRSMTQKGELWKLFEHLMRYFGEVDRLPLEKARKLQSHALVDVLSLIGTRQDYWAQVLKKAATDPEFEAVLAYLLYFLQFCGCRVQVSRIPTVEPFALTPGKSIWFWCVHEKYHPLANELHNRTRTVYESEAKWLDRYREQVPDWSVVDELWQRICHENYCSLHASGDTVRFDCAVLNDLRLRSATLTLSGPYPRTKVVLHTDTCGLKADTEFILVNGRLEGLNSKYFEFFEFLTTLAVLQGMWQIVGEATEHYDVGTPTTGNGQSRNDKGRKIPPPRFMRLREGFKASERGKENALIFLGRLPAEGSTCRVYDVSSFSQNGHAKRVTTVVKNLPIEF